MPYESSISPLLSPLSCIVSSAHVYAFCMGQHPRLGARSPIRFLGQEIIHHIFETLRQHLGESLHLRIVRHVVHHVASRPDGSRELIVSNLRRFEVSASIIVSDALLDPSRLSFDVSLCLGDGSPLEATIDENPQHGAATTRVAATSRDEESWLAPLLGSLHAPVDATDAGGPRVSWRLQMGRRVLSSRLDGRLVRLRLSPSDAAVRAAFPALTCITDPMRVVGRLRGDAAPHLTPHQLAQMQAHVDTMQQQLLLLQQQHQLFVQMAQEPLALPVEMAQQPALLPQDLPLLAAHGVNAGG